MTLSLCWLLCIVLICTGNAGAFGQTQSPPKPSLQEKIVLIKTGSIIEVKTKDKRTVKGRLLATTSESFDVQTAKGQSIGTETFRFDQVKSVKEIQKEDGMGTAAKITIGVLAGVGVVFLILILVAAHGWD